MHTLRLRNLLLASLLLINCVGFAQSGMSVSPSRIYFAPGGKSEQTIIVRNPNKAKELEVGISLSDWEYDSLGNNVIHDAGKLATSFTENIQISSGSFFTLAPEETKTIKVSIKGTPSNSVSVRTSMLYLTQLNPGDGGNQHGAAIKVAVRMGIKLYYTAIVNTKPNVDISNFMVEKLGDKPTNLKLYVNNTGNSWLEGKIRYELLNQDTGNKYKLEDTEFFSLPNDKRVFIQKLPENMKSGNYTVTAVVRFSKSDIVKIAELTFKL